MLTGLHAQLREMDADLAHGQKPEFVSGGFVGHCTNRHTLRYDIKSNPTNQVIRARLRKDGNFHSQLGKHKLADEPVRFYDYNF